MYEGLSPEQKRDWISLFTLSGIGHATIIKLVNYFGKPSRILKATRVELEVIPWLSPSKILAILKGVSKEQVDDIINTLNKLNTNVLTFNDPEYPKSLRDISFPPSILFFRGNIELLSDTCLAVVGTRRFSPYGRNVSALLSKSLVENGIVVVSGLAKGIDTFCHDAVLQNNGKTVAVKGCGIDVYYPRENKALEEAIAKKGLVITEFLPGAQPESHNFPMRNRLISGISKGIVVIEAARKSGALITAHYALDQGKSVMAIPGSIFSETSKGCNWLIKQGAILVDDIQDILNELNFETRFESFGSPLPEISKIEDILSELTEEEKSILDAIADSSVYIDDISEKTNIPITKILSALTQMELKDLVETLPGQFYKRAF
jgi:DNA processing protein